MEPGPVAPEGADGAFGFTLVPSPHPIIPVMLGDATVAANGRPSAARRNLCGGVQLSGRTKGRARIRLRLSTSPRPRAARTGGAAVPPPSARTQRHYITLFPDLVPPLLKIRVLDRRVEIQRRLPPSEISQVRRPFIQVSSTRPPIWAIDDVVPIVMRHQRRECRSTSMMGKTSQLIGLSAMSPT